MIGYRLPRFLRLLRPFSPSASGAVRAASIPETALMLAPAAALLLAAAAGSAAAPAAPVENPHGDFRADCAICHVPESWTPAKVGPGFDHSKFGEPLEGAHRDVPCLMCHLTLEFHATTGTRCADCHQDVHAGELGTECDRCHTTRSFIDRTDDVRTHRLTRFPLTGAHATLDCEQCHGGGGGAAMQFVNTPTECIACHRSEYDAATDPVHTPASFPSDCTRCHTTFAWGSGTFDHSLTGFALTGAHRGVECVACHGGTDGGQPQFAGTSPECASCHLTAYQAATNPVHTPASFPMQCALCHSTAGWQPASFDHGATAFPLTGAHRQTDCAACHGGGQFTGTPTDCFACHQADYNGTTNPSHLASGFGTNCASCHGTTSWEGASFDHDATAFPLTGAHRQAECAACHVGGQFSGTPTDCFACHQADYNGTTDPNHLAAGFGTNCASCHNTTGWEGASFDHDAAFFPIYSGAHQGRWQDCATCHTQPNDYRVFTCLDCHAHEQSSMDSHHQGVGGYVYSSDACYSCHPRGRADD